jgi:hypothetical protein
MNSFIKAVSTIFVLSFFFYQISCNGKPTESSTGSISISVVDNDPEETPIPDVAITILPGNIVLKTDANGKCSIKVEPGDYYVDADVCCIGPGNIHYHEPVNVSANETEEVKLVGCLACL